MPPLPRPLLLVLFAGALAAAWWRAPAPAAMVFSAPPAAAASNLPAQFSAEMLPRADGAASHPTLAELSDGRLAAAWLAGSDDEPAIRFSVLDREGWRPPTVIASRESTAGGTFAYVGHIGQPVLHAEGSWLHLWYVSRTLGSSINHSVSTDGGKRWAKPSRLQTSPLATPGGEVGTPPAPLADGGLALAITDSATGQQYSWLRLAPTGQILDKVRVTTVSTGGEHLPEGGAHMPVAVLRLKSGRLLLAGNPAGGPQALQLWLSADQGQTWQASRTVESAPDGGAQFAHPALLLGRDGRIHLAYDWRRQGIRHAAFSEAWVDGGAP